MKKFDDLDPLLHSQLRLAVMSVLVTIKEAEFSFIKDTIDATAGNLSASITKLKEAGYVDVEKKFKDNYPLTICRITQKGLDAFERYVQNLKVYLEPK